MITIKELEQIKPRTTPQTLKISRGAKIEYYLQKCHCAVNDLFCLVARFLNKHGEQTNYLTSFPFVLEPCLIAPIKQYELWDDVLYKYERGGGKSVEVKKMLRRLIKWVE